jgi:ABC-type glycerol-3-phosphate transport system permease component
MKKKETRTDIFCSALLWLLSLTVFLPLLMIVFTSFKDKKEGATLNLVLPAKWMWENYVQVLKTGNVLRALGNSVFVSAVTLVIVLITASMLGYMIARLNTRGSRFVDWLVGLGIIVRNADHDAAAEHEDLWRRVGPDLRILRAVSSVFNHDHHQLYPGASKRAG